MYKLVSTTKKWTSERYFPDTLDDDKRTKDGFKHKGWNPARIESRDTISKTANCSTWYWNRDDCRLTSTYDKAKR